MTENPESNKPRKIGKHELWKRIMHPSRKIVIPPPKPILQWDISPHFNRQREVTTSSEGGNSDASYETGPISSGSSERSASVLAESGTIATDTRGSDLSITETSPEINNDISPNNNDRDTSIDDNADNTYGAFGGDRLDSNRDGQIDIGNDDSEEYGGRGQYGGSEPQGEQAAQEVETVEADTDNGQGDGSWGDTPGGEGPSGDTGGDSDYGGSGGDGDGDAGDSG